MQLFPHIHAVLGPTDPLVVAIHELVVVQAARCTSTKFSTGIFALAISKGFDIRNLGQYPDIAAVSPKDGGQTMPLSAACSHTHAAAVQRPM